MSFFHQLLQRALKSLITDKKNVRADQYYQEIKTINRERDI